MKDKKIEILSAWGHDPVAVSLTFSEASFEFLRSVHFIVKSGEF